MGTAVSRLFASILTAVVVLIGISLLLGFLGHLHPGLDALSHFRLHLAVLLILAGLGLAVWRWFAFGMVAAATGLAAIVVTLGEYGSIRPEMLRADAAQHHDEHASYRLLHLNLRYDNATPERVISLIGRVRPDMLTLTEVSEMWREKLEVIAHAYPYRLVCPPPTRIGGVAILSRRPFGEGEPQCLERGALARVRINLGGRELDVAALHLGWPWPFDQPRRARSAANHLTGLADTAIVAGDFNAAPWSWTVRGIAAEARLRLSGAAGPTWLFLGMPDLLRRQVGLPLDHVLVKGGVITHSLRRLEDVGSDHLPILQEFSLLPVEEAKNVLQALAR